MALRLPPGVEAAQAQSPEPSPPNRYGIRSTTALTCPRPLCTTTTLVQQQEKLHGKSSQTTRRTTPIKLGPPGGISSPILTWTPHGLRVEAKLILGYSLPGTPYLLAKPPHPSGEEAFSLPGGSPKRKKKKEGQQEKQKAIQREMKFYFTPSQGHVAAIELYPLLDRPIRASLQCPWPGRDLPAGLAPTSPLLQALNSAGWPRLFSFQRYPSQLSNGGPHKQPLARCSRPAVAIGPFGGRLDCKLPDLASLFVMHPYFARQQNMTWHGVYDKQLKGHVVFLEFTCMTPVNTRFLQSRSL